MVIKLLKIKQLKYRYLTIKGFFIDKNYCQKKHCLFEKGVVLTNIFDKIGD
jgi:hypothetical protein